MRRWIFGLSAAVGTTALVLACSVGTDCDFGLCAGPTVGPGGDGGGGDGADVGLDGDGAGTPPGCKPELDPKDAAPCVVDSYGIFVDASQGLDANPGTKAAPVKTLSAAIAKVGTLPRVYVCEGNYAEHVKLTRALSIYGGFACGSWTYSAGKTRIAPSDVGIALQISSATNPIVVADLEIVAQPGTKTEPSSIAMFVARSTGVTGRRLNIQAGAGFSGDPGAPGTPGTTTEPTLDGKPGDGTTGGAERLCVCSTGGFSKGARGGDTGGVAPDGQKGETAYTPSTPLTATGDPGTRAGCEAGSGAGRPGSDAPNGMDGPPPSVGVLDENGWTVGTGEAGVAGKPGQGGGGGGSYNKGAPSQNGGGGGGGCGGCGGGGGGGGNGGGSSVALLAFESTLKLESSSLAASDAGDGGAGIAGQTGVPGGNGGTSAAMHSGCAGGTGGNGGKGGGGAGGSGGISAGILYKGSVPVVDPTTDAAIKFGKPGGKGVGGGQANDGTVGDAKKTVAL